MIIDTKTLFNEKENAKKKEWQGEKKEEYE